MIEIDVTVYGTICLDMLWRVASLPPPGGYVEILDEKKAIGGEAANTAIALVKWGVRTALVGNAIADDADGTLLKGLFLQDVPELDTQWMRFDGNTQTPYCVCMATPDGQRTMFGHRFADLQCVALDPSLASKSRFFTMEPNAYQSGLQACGVASSAGCEIVAMDYAQVPSVNRVSSLVLTSSEHVDRGLSADQLCTFAERVRNMDGCGPTTIVTRGEHGCVVATTGSNEPAELFPAYTCPNIVDSTGSGDIFRAGMLYGLVQNWDLGRSLKFASAAACLNCTAVGGWGGIKSVAEIEEFILTATVNET